VRIQISIQQIGLAVLFAALLVACSAPADDMGETFEQGFLTPPDSAKPRVWWHWMHGNITIDGIQKDLEWMDRVGIGGFQNFDAALNTPQVVEKRLVYMTPEWQEAFRFATTKADELGLEMAIAGSPGWSESGGPWVPPEQAMKKYVWSETWVDGGQPFHGMLPRPPTNSGPFQNIPLRDALAMLTAEAPPPPEYYADSAVVAFRAPGNDLPLSELDARVTASGGNISAASLKDGNLVDTVSLPMAPVGQQAWIQFDFGEPQVVQAVSLAMGPDPNPLAQFMGGGSSGPHLEASDDGREFRSVVQFPTGGAPQHSVSFAPVTARYFRLSFVTPARAQGMGIPGMDIDPSILEELGISLQAPTHHEIAELVLHPAPRVNRFEDKAGFSTATNLYTMASPAVAASDTISRDDVIDLTESMQPDGTLDWTPPEGRWVVLRIGYSLLGIVNHPASPEATGLEVDKLNAEYVKAYMDNYLGQYEEATGGLMGERGLQYVITDSFEAGAQNWTDNIIDEFTERRGYDMKPWLPVLAGRVVESAEASDRFLWDFRKTLAELMAEYHYDQITDSLKERGMGRYSESHENGRALLADGMDVKRTADVPMSAMWTGRGAGPGMPANYNADIRESASVAHIYGQNLVAAESLTAAGGAYTFSPETLKPTADAELAMGLNRFVIHTSVHQPVDDKIPGLSLGPFGQWFNRHETWAEKATPWVSYLARSSYMLQQGEFAADVVYYYGEDSNITALFGENPPEIPDGYGYDFINSNALLNVLDVNGGLLTTPSGMSYRVLAIDENARYMPLPVLEKIRELVNAGAVVVGPKPIASPSLSDDQEEFASIADQLWGSGTGEHSVGRGTVYAGQSVVDALNALEVEPDFEYTKPAGDTTLLFVHRKMEAGDFYWVANRRDRVEEPDVTFRVDGKAAELWYPQTGEMKPASYRIANGRTTVPLHLDPFEAVFVVFREDADGPSRMLPEPVETPLATVEGAWDVSFQSDRGAPPEITLDELSSWSENPDAGVRYFSGTATYTKTLDAPADWFEDGAEVWLDLGDVKNIAEVTVNGQPLGIVWKRPFRVDVTEVLQPGENDLEIEVTSLWVNRLVGDQQPGNRTTYTWTSQQFYRADSPLLPSGLLGPVEVVRAVAE